MLFFQLELATLVRVQNLSQTATGFHKKSAIMRSIEQVILNDKILIWKHKIEKKNHKKAIKISWDYPFKGASAVSL
jgi:hypothetical protein